ncbi:MAG: GMC family oxidoreductase N-terminal domain-containing protein [Actinomycetales bacterium]
MASLTDLQRQTLTTLCNTIVPSLDHTPDPYGLWARSADDLHVPAMVEQALLAMPAPTRDGLLGLLDGLAGAGFNQQSQESREQSLKVTGLVFGVPAQAGIAGLIQLIGFLAYGAPDPETGQNPMWAAMRYPGPVSPPPNVPKPITPVVPEGDSLTLEADVAIVGSGCGGGVIAGVLAAGGLKVAVLEAGPYLNESDYDMLEVPAFTRGYWRGGPQSSADLGCSVLAGAALGGGSAINWTNCLRTTQVVRDEWAEAGLKDVATDFDRHLDAVAERMSINKDCSELSPFFERLRESATRLGWDWEITHRNVDPERHDPATAGYVGFGDQTGAKMSTDKTYLQDAFDAGGDIVVHTTVDRVIVENGRAAGVVGTYTDPETGRQADVTVRAPRVVIAAGTMESPAVLLRSGIGGAMVGQRLHAHPVVAAFGVFDEEVKSWWGAPHTLLINHFEKQMQHGFRMEGVNFMPGVFASGLPYKTAAQHKALVEKIGTGGGYLTRIRDRGEGRVVLDENGQAQFYWRLTDPDDVAAMRLAVESVVRLFIEAGARELMLLGNAPAWRVGDDVEEYLAALGRQPLGFGGLAVFSAHQMGTCRMGSDPETSVADPRGELHDTPGVWIGDTSAFPTASGTNPMWSVLALAHRTAENILDDVRS